PDAEYCVSVRTAKIWGGRCDEQAYRFFETVVRRLAGNDTFRLCLNE
ncbi:MAG: hypothetical protein ACI89J_001801, partial [Hyphomicrobiaceae bacterium]